jgi:hypothetical protein
MGAWAQNNVYLALGGFGIGLLANVIAGVDTSKASNPWLSQVISNFGAHWLPLTVCVISLLLSAVLYSGSLFLKRSLP